LFTFTLEMQREAQKLAEARATVMILTPSFNHDDFQDIVQAMILKLLKSMAKFDPDKGAFGPFARVVFHYHGLNMIRTKMRQITTVPIDTVDMGRDDSEEAPASILMELNEDEILLKIGVRQAWRKLPLPTKSLMAALKEENPVELADHCWMTWNEMKTHVKKLQNDLMKLGIKPSS